MQISFVAGYNLGTLYYLKMAYFYWNITMYLLFICISYCAFVWFNKWIHWSEMHGFDNCKTAILGSPISNKIWVIKTLIQREGRNNMETPHVQNRHYCIPFFCSECLVTVLYLKKHKHKTNNISPTNIPEP
jgi:hypothetical protein